MTLRNGIQGITALVLVSLALVGCVAQTDSDVDESVGTSEQAINPTPECPQGPGTVLVSTGAATASMTDGLYPNACNTTSSIVRRTQYQNNTTARTDLGAQCKDWCTDHDRFSACGTGWRLDSALGNQNVIDYFVPPNGPGAFDTAPLQAMQIIPGQSGAAGQEVTCLQRPNVNAAGNDERQWVAICSCSNLAP